MHTEQQLRREASVTRTGKIARLPQPVRERLNRRLREAEPGGPLLEWLKEQACVPLMATMMPGPLAEAFGGGAAGRQAAALVLELRHDLEPGDSDAKTRTRSDRVKPSQTESNRVKPSQTESNRVKPSQTTFPGNQPAVCEAAGGE